MKILDRLKLLARADAHGVMDQLEERSLLLKQHLREAEIELVRKRAQLESLAEERRRVSEEAGRLERRVQRLDEDVELALAGDNEELARFTVRRLLPRREALRSLRGRGEELAQSAERLQALLAEQEQAFAELRAQVSARLVEAAQRPPTPCADMDMDGPVPDEEVELELLRRRNAQGAEAS